MESERAKAAGRSTSMTADLALRRGASPDRCAGLIRKLQDSFDRQVTALGEPEPACKPKCDACCHRPVWVSPAEMATLADYLVKNHDASRLQSLIEASTLYDGKNGSPCPLLSEGLCSAYDARPFTCRGINSVDPSECRAAAAGKRDWDVSGRVEQVEIAEAIRTAVVAASGKNGAPTKPLLLGSELGGVLTDPAEFESRFPAPTEVRAMEAPTQGAIPGLDQYVKELSERGNTLRAIEAISGASPTIRTLLSLIVPRAYDSGDQIKEWESRWDQTFDQLSNTDLDLRQAFEGLALHVPSELAYHGNSVKERYSQLGDLIVDRIAKPLYPDLSEPISSPRKPGKLRVGYISHALRYNNGGRWALGWLENHGKDIETYSFNLFTEEDRDSRRFKASSDHYYHLTGPVEPNARLIKSLDLDVLIYTDIGVCGTNTQYACLRLARVQCTAWGHPVTSGLPTIDAYLSSDLMEPADADSHYRERLVRLPNSGLCYERLQHAPTARNRQDFGLPSGFLPLLAQNLTKCIPKWDFLYREICERINGPIAVLEGIHPFEQEVTKRRLEKAGVRVHWIPRFALRDYYRLQQLCDVSLDTPAWNGGNTTIEFLTLGTPMVTLPTEYMRGRHSLAFMKIANVPQLIATTPEEYVDLATDRDRLREGMRGVQPDELFDDASTAHALDAFMHEVTGV